VVAEEGKADEVSTPTSTLSLAQQMLEEGSLPDMPASGAPGGPPMRAVLSAASTRDPDKEAQTQQLAAQAGMGVDLARANPQAAEQRAVVSDLDRRQIEIRNPILASQLRDPNFAGVAHDDLDSLSSIDSGAATVRAATWRERANAWADWNVGRQLTEYPLTRMGIDAVAGTEGMLGNIGSFFGWHGSGPDRQNLLQSEESGAAPERYGLQSNDLDTLVKSVAPMIPAMLASGGTGALARTLGLSENAAKVLTAAGVGSAFSADQGGRTFTQMAGAGRSDDEARHDADIVAGVNLPANVAMGLTDFAPFLKRNPLLAAVGVGGAAGATGQLAQNIVTGDPWWKGMPEGAAEGAAVQGGMHVGMSAIAPGEAAPAEKGTAPLAEIADAVEQSKLRARSPQAFQSFLDRQFDGDASLRIPAQDFVNYFHAKGIDPAEMANRVGVTNLGEAALAGSDLEIPPANFFGQLEPEHVKALLPDVIDPATEMTPRQTEAGREELKQWVADGGPVKLQAEYAQADAETQATPEWKSVYSDLKQRYADAGETDQAADNYATLHANAIANLAKNAGLKPDELLAMHNPDLVMGDVAGAPLFQSPAERQRQALNLESARVQGEMLTGAKQPWQMTLDEYKASMKGQRVEKIPPLNREGTLQQMHEDRISSALQARADVPGKVLDEAVARNPYTAVAKQIEAVRAEKAESTAAHSETEESPAQAEGARGWFRVLPDGRYQIGKTSLGDMSTFIHEPAHAYLELFRELTQRGGGSQPLKDDFEKIAKWLGTTPEEAYKSGFTREQHEQWARANEEYVREGKAPTSGLRRAFQNFSVWLGSIYRRAGALGVELSPEIRGVMDRLYAGDSAVDRAEQRAGGQKLFETPEEAGWTEAEYRNYAEAKGLEIDKAREQVRAEMNDAALRERTQQWREEKGNVRDALTQEIDARPEYAAIRSLRRGKTDLGTDLTLNRDELVRQFGEERVKALQDLHRGLYRQEGGTDATTAGELLGFGSGEEMMRAIESAPRRAQTIEANVRDVMSRKYGDIRYDGTIDEKARLAVENEDRAKGLHKELATLRAKLDAAQKKAADTKAAMAAMATEPLERYQEAARQMIEQKTIADLQPYRYLNASRKFSREAFDALRKGNVRAAAEAKNKELLNHFLFREASAARDYADKFESYAKRMQSRGIQQRLGLADENVRSAGGTGDFREQFNWLMARYRLGPTPQAPERSLRAWADDVYGQGNEVAIAPGILNEGRFVDYRNAPLSEVRDLHDALTNIRHLALQQFKMFVQGKQVDFAEAKQAMIASARENLKSRPETVFGENRTLADKALDPVRYVDARLMRTERLVEWLDGGKTGPWHDNLWNLAADAQGDEYTLQEDVTRRVTDALDSMPAEMRRRLWTEKVSVEGVPEPLPRRRILSMAFNMGNEGNLDRLRRTFTSFGWDPDAIRRIGGMLTRDEWEFVQKSWDSLKPLGERMKELEQRLTGLPPAMVKVTPFKAALDDGTEMELEGGYFPIVMDPRFSQRAIEQDSRESAQNAMQQGYVRATTSKGYTKERTGFGGPLLLDYEQALTSHVAKVTKDLSHREFMLSSQRLLLDTEVRRTLRETLGPQYEQQFMPWLRTIINDNNGSVQERLDGLKDAMQKLRGNVVAASLGFNFSTSLLQLSHAPRMLLYARPASLAQSFAELLAHPMERSQETRDLSPNEMRFRGDNLDRDIRAVLQNPEYRQGYTRKVAVAARFALEAMDHVLSHTLWRAAFNDSLANHADLPEDEAQKKAALEADSAVRLGLGTSAPKDLPAIMRSNEFNKFITTLYGFHNGVYNQLRDSGHQFRYDGGGVGQRLGKLAYAGILTAVLPAVLGSWLTGQRPKDDENPSWWAAKRSLLFSADTVPLLRSVASFMDGGHDVQFSPVESVMQNGAKAAMEATSSKDDKDWLGIGLDAADVAGELGGVPGSRQAVKTLRYMKRAGEGKVQNPNLWGAVVGGR
jgi:Large polyvalent protein associated domain 22